VDVRFFLCHEITSLTVNPLPDCKFPAINHQFFNDLQASKRHGWLFVLYSIRRNYAREI